MGGLSICSTCPSNSINGAPSNPTYMQRPRIKRSSGNSFSPNEANMVVTACAHHHRWEHQKYQQLRPKCQVRAPQSPSALQTMRQSGRLPDKAPILNHKDTVASSCSVLKSKRPGGFVV